MPLSPPRFHAPAPQTNKSSARIFNGVALVASLVGHIQEGGAPPPHFALRRGPGGDRGHSVQGTSCCIGASAFLPSSHSIALSGGCGESRGFPAVAYKLVLGRGW